MCNGAHCANGSNDQKRAVSCRVAQTRALAVEPQWRRLTYRRTHAGKAFVHEGNKGSVVQASSLQATSPQRAPARAQLNAGLPSRALTLLCVRHNHCDSSARDATVGGSALRGSR